LPPLREIRTDIPLLCAHFIEGFNRDFRKEIGGVSAEALELLESWDWPGNVRELRNVLERACIFCQGDEILPNDVPALSRPTASDAEPAADFTGAFPIPEGLTLAEAEAEYIRHALDRVHGNVQRAAEGLGISRKNLWEKRKKYGLLE
jgi:DNA-binding NtrC family response regulator